MILSGAVLSVVLTLVLRSTSRTEASPIIVDDPDACNTLECQNEAQAIRDSMNTSIDPCQDFYQYACGGWIHKHPIPDEKDSYSVTALMVEKVSRRVAEILKNTTSENSVKPVLQATALYEGCMDEDAREKEGVEPLKNLLNSIGGWPMINPDWSDVGYQWQEQVANVIRMFYIDIIIGFGIDVDDKNSSRHIIILHEASLGLGRYTLLNLSSSERNEEIIEAYKNYMVQSAKLLNPDVDEAQLIADVEEVIQFETALAELTSPLGEEEEEPGSMNNTMNATEAETTTELTSPTEEEEDTESMNNRMNVTEPETATELTTAPEKEDEEQPYHKMNLTEADRRTENTYFKWKDFINIVLQDYPEVTDETEIVVGSIDFLTNAIKLANDTNVRTIANYIGWILAKNLGDRTTKEFRINDFNFRSVVSGVEKPEKLEKICSGDVMFFFEFAIGRLYIDKYFTEQEKNDVEVILEDIRSAFELKLNHNTWMDSNTKRKALEKVRAMTSVIAYPPWIRNDQKLIDYYSSVPDIKKEEYFSSLLKTVQSIMAVRYFKKWKEPVEETTEYIRSPSEVNAFYYAHTNTMAFPAGYLIMPQYKYGRSMALNYGGIGITIGHEISHGFDDDGHHYDKEGNLVDWWSKEAKDHFDSKVTCFKRQYSSYVEPTTNMTLNGNLTVGDDIADNGGVRSAFLAYKVRLLESVETQTAKRLPGIHATLDQLFFLGYATTYCGHRRKESLEWRIENTDHTIDKYRVIVPLSNSRDFAQAFNCPRGSPMNPVSKCILW